jgi:hypothetical protein
LRNYRFIKLEGKKKENFKEMRDIAAAVAEYVK